jgi:hypothetical protein
MVNIGLIFCWLHGQIHESKDEDAEGILVIRLPGLLCTKICQRKILSKVTHKNVIMILMKAIVFSILV